MIFNKKIRANIRNHNIYIENCTIKQNEDIEIFISDLLTENITTFDVYCDNSKFITYTIEPMESNEKLKDKYINYSIRVLSSKGIMIDGIVTDKKDTKAKLTDGNIGYRFQPFFLPMSKYKNEDFFGYGLFKRGLIYPGYVTPLNVKLVLVCDSCKKPFTIKHYHAGFSELQYFYSKNGLKAVSIDYYHLGDFPGQSQKPPTDDQLKEMNKKLFKYDPENQFSYYNPFKCKYCGYSYIDFEKYPNIRPNEYYVYLHKEEELLKINNVFKEPKP